MSTPGPDGPTPPTGAATGTDPAPDAFGAAVEAVDAAGGEAGGRVDAAGREAVGPAALLDGLRSIEESEALDPAVAGLGQVADAVVRPGVVGDVLTGKALGHAAHPFLTDLPIGFWTSTSVLDVIGGRASRKAADRLLALGLVSALPTIATGLAEWRDAGQRNQRVGVVHSAANSVGLAFYTASYLARKRGHRARGVLLALAGMGAASVGGYLGGHLAVARKVGTRDPTFTRPPVG